MMLDFVNGYVRIADSQAGKVDVGDANRLLGVCFFFLLR